MFLSKIVQKKVVARPHHPANGACLTLTRGKVRLCGVCLMMLLRFVADNRTNRLTHY